MAQDSRRKGRPKNFYEKPSQPTIQALDRALDVLTALSSHAGLTLSELAAELDQSPATMHRVLATLEARDMVEMDPRNQTWHIGAMSFQLGSAFMRRSGVIERSRPVMRALMEQTGETSNLGIERQANVLFVSQVETNETIRAFFPPGTISPMHASGIGKALLCHYADDRLTQFLRDQPLEQFTGHTITSDAALREDLDLSRQRGWAFDNEEKTDGMRCVAAPILNMFGEAIAGISVSGPTHRMPEDKIEDLGAMVRDAAVAVAGKLGTPAQSED